jgi:hypothetical protein
LRHWGLVAQVEGKRGYWLITRAGGMFLRGEVDTPISVSTQDNHRVGKTEQCIRIRELRSESCAGRYRSFRANGRTKSQRSSYISRQLFHTQGAARVRASSFSFRPTISESSSLTFFNTVSDVFSLARFVAFIPNKTAKPNVKTLRITNEPLGPMTIVL